MATEVVITPEYVNVLRWQANAYVTHSFDFGARGPMCSFLEVVRYLQQTEPEALQKIIDEFREPTVVRDADPGT